MGGEVSILTCRLRNSSFFHLNQANAILAGISFFHLVIFIYNKVIFMIVLGKVKLVI